MHWFCTEVTYASPSQPPLENKNKRHPASDWKEKFWPVQIWQSLLPKLVMEPVSQLERRKALVLATMVAARPAMRVVNCIFGLVGWGSGRGMLGGECVLEDFGGRGRRT